MNGRERVQRAMQGRDPDKVPVMCQLAVGHILLNTDVDPVSFNFNNAGYARGLLQIRDLYDFDGILIHKPGREEQVLDLTDRRETRDGIRLVFPDGGSILCQFNDDPLYFFPDDYQPPGLDDVEPASLLDGVPKSQKHFWLHKGVVTWLDAEDTPDFYYGCIDRVLETTQGQYSVHGEVNAPIDNLIHVLGAEEVMLGLIMHPQKVHRLLDFFAETMSVWAGAQVRRGCDAIKLSSPWAGGGFISRDHYKEFILPYERKIVEAVHEAGAPIYTHTCGAIGDRIDLLVDSGADGVECLDPPPLGNVELADAKAKWGDEIFIKGNVDSVNTLLQAGPDEVRADVTQRLSIGAPGGGFILSSACSIAPQVPPENIQAMVETAREWQHRPQR